MMTLFNDTELFTSGDPTITKFDIPDAELSLYEHFFNREESDTFYKELVEQTPWKQEPITIHGKTHPTPRLTAWYGKRRDNKTELALTSTLLYLKSKVEQSAKVEFNSVLLNLYRNGQDSVSWHRDNEREYGPRSVIGSVTFGETRIFQIRHKFRKDLTKIEILLHHGSFLLMAGTMQHFWEHQIAKTAKQIKPRVNLTFRVVLT
jgi:alkylated DNA repair dioxygenase AlkB